MYSVISPSTDVVEEQPKENRLVANSPLSLADQMAIAKFSLKHFKASVTERENLKKRIIACFMNKERQFMDLGDLAMIRELVAQDIAPSIGVHEVRLDMKADKAGVWQRVGSPSAGQREWKWTEGSVHFKMLSMDLYWEAPCFHKTDEDQWYFLPRLEDHVILIVRVLPTTL